MLGLAYKELWTEYELNSSTDFQSTWFTNTYYHDSRSEFIITKEDLENVGIFGETAIKGLMFNLTGYSAMPINYLEIGMKHTWESELANEEVFKSYDEFEVVFMEDGGFAFDYGWFEFFFETPFIWDGQSNIQVCLIKDNDAFARGGGVGGRILPTDEIRYIGGQHDSLYDPPYDGLMVTMRASELPQTIVIVDEANETTVPPNTPSNLQPIDKTTVGSSVTFSATLIDNEDDSINETISLIVEYSTDSKFLTNVTSIVSDRVKSGETITVSAQALPNGVYYWRAKAVDSGSLYSSYTKTRTFTVENKKPYLTDMSPANNAIITSSSITISATPIDLDNEICMVYLEFSKDIYFSNIIRYDSANVNSGITANFYISNLLQGNYYWRMRVSDSSGIMSNYTAYRGVFVSIQTEENGRLSPDSIIELTGLTGSVSSIQDDPDTPNSSWLTTTGQTDSIVRVSFPTPRFNLRSGASLQNFRVQVRSNAPSGSGTAGTVYIDLYENGVQKTSQSFSLAKTSSSSVFQLSWNANLLSNMDGRDVECRVRGVGVYSGGQNSRWSVEVGAIEWNYQSGYTGETHNPATTDSPPSNITNLTGITTGNSSSLSWKNPTDSDFNHLEIYRNNVLIHGAYDRNSYVDQILSPNTSYTYRIVSVDVAGNKSNGTSLTVVTDPIDIALPQVEIINVSTYKIGRAEGANISLVRFIFDVDITAWTVNVMGVSYDSGYVADSGGAVTAGTEIVAEIDWTELYQEGENRINIYGKNANGWTLFED